METSYNRFFDLVLGDAVREVEDFLDDDIFSIIANDTGMDLASSLEGDVSLTISEARYSVLDDIKIINLD